MAGAGGSDPAVRDWGCCDGCLASAGRRLPTRLPSHHARVLPQYARTVLKRRLRLAAARGTREEVEELVAQLKSAGCRVGMYVDETEKSALHIAAGFGNYDAAAALLAAGANVGARDAPFKIHRFLPLGLSTPLHAAAEAGAVDVAKLLLSAGTDVNADNMGGRTPLHRAVQGGCADMVELLVGAGAEVDAPDDIRATPLWRAAADGSTNVVAVLLGQGAAVNRACAGGATPLMAAATRGHPKMLRALLDAGASLETVDGDDFTALTLAADRGHDACVAALLAAGAAVEGSGWGPAPVARAAARGHGAVVARLLAAGASCGAHALHGLECALAPVWQTAPARLPYLAQHLQLGVLARVRAALAALRLRTPLRQPELYMRVVGLAFSDAVEEDEGYDSSGDDSEDD